jgi:hypothetical protein
MQWTPKKIRAALQERGFAVFKQKSLPFVFWPICLHHLAVADKPTTGI